MDIRRLARASNYKSLTVRHPKDPKNAMLRGARPSDMPSSGENPAEHCFVLKNLIPINFFE